MARRPHFSISVLTSLLLCNWLANSYGPLASYPSLRLKGTNDQNYVEQALEHREPS